MLHIYTSLFSLFFLGGGYLLAIWALDSYEEALLAVYSILLLDSVIKSSLPGVAFEVIVKVWLSYLYSRHLSLYLLSASTKQVNFHFFVA